MNRANAQQLRTDTRTILSLKISEKGKHALNMEMQKPA